MAYQFKVGDRVKITKTQNVYGQPFVIPSFFGKEGIVIGAVCPFKFAEQAVLVEVADNGGANCIGVKDLELLAETESGFYPGAKVRCTLDAFQKSNPLNVFREAWGMVGVIENQYNSHFGRAWVVTFHDLEYLERGQIGFTNLILEADLELVVEKYVSPYAIQVKTSILEIFRKLQW